MFLFCSIFVETDRPDRPDRPERPERPDRPDRPDQPERYPGGGYSYEYMGMGGVSSGSVGGYRPYGMYQILYFQSLQCS